MGKKKRIKETIVQRAENDLQKLTKQENGWLKLGAIFVGVFILAYVFWWVAIIAFAVLYFVYVRKDGNKKNTA